MASFTDYSSNRHDEPEFNLREWDRKARITRENPSSRRFSASYIRSFREDARSSGTNNFTISSTASSPGYPLKEEIDPSTYSFSSALKALQAKTVYNNWDWLTPEGFALNSKWNEAEKYICNPLSGEVPMECLSAKTLSGRSFRSTLTNRFTMSAPLFFPNNPKPNSHHPPTLLIPQNPKPTCINIKVIHEDRNADPAPVPPPEKKVPGLKRDVGVQSTPADLSSGSPSPAETPPITERFLKRQVEADDSSAEFVLNSKTQEREEVKPKEEEKEEKKQEMGEKEEDDDDDDEAEEEAEEEEEEEKKNKKKEKKEKRGSNGCWSWMRKRQRHKHKPTKSNNIFPICVPHLKGC